MIRHRSGRPSGAATAASAGIRTRGCGAGQHLTEARRIRRVGGFGGWDTRRSAGHGRSLAEVPGPLAAGNVRRAAARRATSVRSDPRGTTMNKPIQPQAGNMCSLCRTCPSRQTRLPTPCRHRPAFVLCRSAARTGLLPRYQIRPEAPDYHEGIGGIRSLLGAAARTSLASKSSPSFNVSDLPPHDHLRRICSGQLSRLVTCRMWLSEPGGKSPSVPPPMTQQRDHLRSLRDVGTPRMGAYPSHGGIPMAKNTDQTPLGSVHELSNRNLANSRSSVRAGAASRYGPSPRSSACPAPLRPAPALMSIAMWTRTIFPRAWRSTMLK